MDVRNELHRLIEQALDDNAHDALIGVVSLQRELDWIERRAVGRARAAGWSWARIARVLGRTGQAVWGRHAAATPPRRATVRPDPGAVAFHLRADTRRRQELEDDPVPW